MEGNSRYVIKMPPQNLAGTTEEILKTSVGISYAVVESRTHHVTIVKLVELYL
jgi:hypothetical protein